MVRPRPRPRPLPRRTSAVDHDDTDNCVIDNSDELSAEAIGAVGRDKVDLENHEETNPPWSLSQPPNYEIEKSQSFPLTKDSERQNWMDKVTVEQRQKISMDLSRLVLFRALAGEPIDRLKCMKIAGVPPRINSAVWEQVKTNLNSVFGLDLVKPPQYMVLPKKYEDRYFCINCIPEGEDGQHSRAIHSVHIGSSIEKGVLMVILSLCFCKGNPHPGYPAAMRWISDTDLYRLLNTLDESLPQDPPSVSNRKSLLSQQKNTVIEGITPNIDFLIEKFLGMDYLLQIKAENTSGSEDITYLAMGPRAALEVGRRQIIFFCSEILGEEPDPTMLQELEDSETQATSPTQ
jgi:MAGE family